MALRDGWFITKDEDGDLVYFILVNGSPYQVELDLNDDQALIISALAPGYYDEDLNPVAAETATAPDDANVEG